MISLEFISTDTPIRRDSRYDDTLSQAIRRYTASTDTPIRRDSRYDDMLSQAIQRYGATADTTTRCPKRYTDTTIRWEKFAKTDTWTQ